MELIRKDKEKFRSARKIPPSGKQSLWIDSVSHREVVCSAATRIVIKPSPKFPNPSVCVFVANGDKALFLRVFICFPRSHGSLFILPLIFLFKVMVS